MDALKFAFDLIIVGALTLPWLWVVLDFFMPQRLDQIKTFVSGKQSDLLRAIAAVLLFAMAYFLGVAVSRAADDFFNDGHIGMEDGVRTAVENELPLHSVISPPMDDPTKKFQLEESALLVQGDGDGTQGLSRLHEQIIVLRGATLNGLILCSLCSFGWCAKRLPVRGQRLISSIILFGPPVLFFGFGVVCFLQHFFTLVPFAFRFEVTDPPFMELILIILGLTGLVTLRRRPESRAYGMFFLPSLLLMIVAGMGWWWTEVLYDRQVIYSFCALSNNVLNLKH